MSARSRRSGRSVIFWVVGIVLAVLFLLPLAWTVYGSFSGPQAGGGVNGFGVAGYVRVAQYGAGIGVYLLNTVIVAAITVGVSVVVTTLAGYALSRLRFRGANVIFAVTLGILMVPYTTTLIPLYIVLGWIGLQNSLLGVGLVLAMLQMPFGLFMLRNSFDSIPGEIEEAALIDGATPFGALMRVMLPGAVPGIVSVAIFAFLASWNDFIAPLIFLTSGSKYTLPLALLNVRSGVFGSVDYAALQAGVVIAAVPCVVIFLLLQRYYVRGFTSGALKG